MIQHYREEGKAPWNFQGFGSNDPGRRRDESTPSLYHKEHPAIPSHHVQIAAGRYTVGRVLRRVKEQLPYLLRYQTDARGGEPGWKEDLDKTVELEHDYEGPADEFLKNLCRSHLPDWQLTYLPLGFILYKEVRNYPSGHALYTRA